jgi:hypothetical protein
VRRLAAGLLAALSLTAFAARADGKLLSVLELRNKLEDADRRVTDAAYLADRVRAEVLDAKLGVRVMTRENMLVLLQAQGKTLEACEGECEVDTGRKLGADYVVSGDLLRVGSSLKVSLRLHETQNGTLVGAVSASGVDVEALDANVPAAVKRLLAALQPQADAAPPPSSPQPQAARPPPAADAVSMRIPSPPSGRWLLVTEDGSMLCVLPCTQRLARDTRYFAEQDADRTSDRHRIAVPPASAFAAGRSAEAEYLSGRGSKPLGFVLLVAGLSVGAYGVGMMLAEHDQFCYSNGSCYDSAQTGLGASTTQTSPDPGLVKGVLIGGVAAAVLGVVDLIISRDEHYEAHVAGGALSGAPGLLRDGLTFKF